VVGPPSGPPIRERAGAGAETEAQEAVKGELAAEVDVRFRPATYATTGDSRMRDTRVSRVPHSDGHLSRDVLRPLRRSAVAVIVKPEVSEPSSVERIESRAKRSCRSCPCCACVVPRPVRADLTWAAGLMATTQDRFLATARPKAAHAAVASTILVSRARTLSMPSSSASSRASSTRSSASSARCRSSTSSGSSGASTAHASPCGLRDPNASRGGPPRCPDSCVIAPPNPGLPTSSFLTSSVAAALL
jgi:hypothetical protein